MINAPKYWAINKKCIVSRFRYFCDLKKITLKRLEVIYEDNHLIAINKPAGALVQGDDTGDRPISDEVKFYIKHRYAKPGDVFLGLIHRIDRPVSGVLIFARTSKALTRMNELFRNKEMDKEYLAISQERPQPMEGKIKNYIWNNPEKGRVSILPKIGRRTKDAKLAETDYKLIGEIEGHHLIQVFPKSGRKHQIRAHMAHIDCIIIGDMRYGKRKPTDDKSVGLHCRSMSFIHPIKKERVRIVAEPPKIQLWNKFRGLIEEI